MNNRNWLSMFKNTPPNVPLLCAIFSFLRKLLYATAKIYCRMSYFVDFSEEIVRRKCRNDFECWEDGEIYICNAWTMFSRHTYLARFSRAIIMHTCHQTHRLIYFLLWKIFIPNFTWSFLIWNNFVICYKWLFNINLLRNKRHCLRIYECFIMMITTLSQT